MTTTGQHIRRNTRSSIIAWFAHKGSRVLIVPLIVGLIGEEGYGLWGIAFGVVSYFTFYNFGMNSAFVRFTAQHAKDQDWRGLSPLLSTGMACGVAMGAVTFATVFLTVDWIAAFLTKIETQIPDVRFTVLCVAAMMAFNMVFGVYRATLTGLQRLDIANNIGVALMLVEFGLDIAFLLSDFGVRGLVYAYMVRVVSSTLVMRYYVWRIAPDIRMSPFRARRSELPKVVSYGGRMQGLGLVTVVVNQLDYLLYSNYQGLAFMGAYMIVRRLCERLQGFAAMGFGALEPASADLHARDDKNMLSIVYSTAGRLAAVVAAGIFAFLSINADNVVHAYVGMTDRYDTIVFSLQFLAVVALIHNLTGPASSMLRGAAKPLREVSYTLLTVVVFLPIYFYARNQGDVKLLLLSFPIGRLVASLFFLVWANRYFKAPLLHPLSNMLLIVVAAPAAAFSVRFGWDASGLAPWVAQHLDGWLAAWTDRELSSARLVALGSVLASGGIYAILFGTVAFGLPGLTGSDRDQLVKFMPMGQRVAARLRRGNASAEG